MSEDWIAALAEDLARRLHDPMESRLSLAEEYTMFGREVAERVRRECADIVRHHTLADFIVFREILADALEAPQNVEPYVR